MLFLIGGGRKPASQHDGYALDLKVTCHPSSVVLSKSVTPWCSKFMYFIEREIPLSFMFPKLCSLIMLHGNTKYYVL